MVVGSIVGVGSLEDAEAGEGGGWWDSGWESGESGRERGQRGGGWKEQGSAATTRRHDALIILETLLIYDSAGYRFQKEC